MMNKKNNSKLIKSLIIISSLLILISFMAPWLLTKFSILDLTETGQIGDTLGGIMNPFIAIAGVIVTFSAFYMQFQANQYQREQFEIQLKKEKEQFRQELDLQKEQFLKNQFESQFYEMLRVHREIVNDLSYNEVYIDESSFKESNIIGIKTFTFLLSELEFSLKLAKENFKDSNIKIQVIEAYGIFWKGVKENEREKHIFFEEALNAKNRLYNLILLGNSNQLAHYYRQLFQTVKFVVYQSIFTYKEKRKYIRILRSQLSNEEQTLLFYNWFSGFGKQWEDENNRFLTDYRMIHNLFPNMLVEEINLEKIFNVNSGYKTEKNRKTDSLFEYQDWEPTPLNKQT